MVDNLHRICLFGDPEGPSPLRRPGTELPFPLDFTADEVELERTGRASRELQGEEYEIRVVSGDIHRVAC